MVEPVYPTYNRAQFDLAPILAKANTISLQGRALSAADQAYAQNEKTNPLELARMQQQNEAGARSNEIGAATESDTIDRIKASAQYGVKSAIAGMDYLSADTAARKTQAIAKVTAYVQAHPEAVDPAAQELVNQGLLKPEDVPEWKQHAADPTLAAGYIAAGDAAQQAMAARGLPPGYGKSTEAITARTAAQTAAADARVLAQANVETNKFMVRNPTATQEQINAYRDGQVAALKGQKGVPAYLPPPPPGPPDWWERNAPEFLGGRAAPAEAAGSVVEDQAQHEKDLTGNAAQTGAQGTKGDRIKPAGAKAGAPAPIDAPATFTGDAADDKAVAAWFNGLPMGSYVVVPGSPAGTAPMQKHSNFK